MDALAGQIPREYVPIGESEVSQVLVHTKTKSSRETFLVPIYASGVHQMLLYSLVYITEKTYTITKILAEGILITFMWYFLSATGVNIEIAELPG